ncbi:MAG: KilA-N domain-containing protein [Proteobacteria bacterium]|nr:KilA-N domain-containing protein [Pseudomonadota bacterium]
MKYQLPLDLIHHEVNNAVIEQRASDGYINATALCKAAGKQFKDYMVNKSTMEFLEELAADTGLQIQLGEKSLVEQKQALIETFPGAPASGGGSWVHPQVAINLGQWASGKFAVKVSKWVSDWLSGKGAPQAPAELPHHLQRYIYNDAKVPQGYFSVLQETGLSLIGPLHNVGFVIPKGWVPDISVGKLYCRWLREQHGVDTDALPVYAHDYLDSRPIVYPKVYPDAYLADFRTWFRTVWLPENGVRYFKTKDPASLVYLNKIPALAPPSQPANLPSWKKKA